MCEEQIFAQELSEEELELVSGGVVVYPDCDKPSAWESEHCVNFSVRHIYEYRFPNCAATVEDGSYCGSNDACVLNEVVYRDMTSCCAAWE